jgi:hypothetical protein
VPAGCSLAAAAQGFASRRDTYVAGVPEYVYELRRADEVLATGRLSDARSFEIGDEVEIAGWVGIVREVLATAPSGELRLIVQVRRQ